MRNTQAQQAGQAPAGSANGAKETGYSNSTASAVSLPKGGGAVRGIGEKFTTNPLTGTGSMSVPIAVSSGRSNIGPQLTLAYDSGAGNGPFGFGWSLSLPSITRKTDKGLPQYIDGEANKPDSDVFILSGAEDLVAVTQGNNMLDIERDGFRIRQYRPRIEGLFARIERWTRLGDGDVFWRTISKDNITTLYGASVQSRIADPFEPSHVFCWLVCESYDDKGDAIRYGYKAETAHSIDPAAVHERNRLKTTRFAQRYLKHIHYGNRAPRQPNEDLTQRSDWMFEVVFDYGEHDRDVPTPTEAQAWPARADAFSTCRPGFEVRTYRLCRRILMFHHFPSEGATGLDEPAIGQNSLVRATELTFDQTPIASYLVTVTQASFRRAGAGYARRALPTMQFEYTKAAIQSELKILDAGSVENLPVGLDGATYQFVDLYGEGAPGVLTDQAGAWFYKRNLSPLTLRPERDQAGRDVTRAAALFASVERVALRPSPGNLGPGQQSQQVMDLAGDGQNDLVQFGPPLAGYFAQDDNERWLPFVPFANQLNIDWADPNLRHVDLSGDGFADVLITKGARFEVYRSLARKGFDEATVISQATDEERGPRLLFADINGSIFLADMNGDGLADVVRIRNGEVCYWPSLGYGHFGAKVTMSNSPMLDTSDQFDPKHIRLADIDGSGVSDIIYLGSDAVRVYLNKSGNGWAAPHAIGAFPRVDASTKVQAMDLLGNGAACLVWSSSLGCDARLPMRYIDLMGGQKPHLLVKSTNNLGAETRVRYAPSTQFYLQDKRDGRPWITKLPFPVHVVERVETIDRISRNQFVTRYAYHHGYFDGAEREFRGFGLVEQFDTETFEAFGATLNNTNTDAASHAPPVHTKTWFHTGAYLDRSRISRLFAHEYYREPNLSDEAAARQLLDDTVLPDNVSLEEEREACRALKGVILRQEVYAQDGAAEAPHPFTVSERNYTIKHMQPRGQNRHGVFFVHPRETLDYHYERRPQDPRISHSLALQVDAFGNVLKSVAVGYGRRAGQSGLNGDDKKKQAQLLLTCIDSEFTTNDTTAPHIWRDVHRAPLPAQTRTYELTGFAIADHAIRFGFDEFAKDNFAIFAASVEIDYQTAPTPGIRQKRLIKHVQVRFRRDDLTALLPLGKLQPKALIGESYKLVFTPGLLNTYAPKINANNLAAILSDEGRYVSLDGDGRWWIPSGQTFYSTNPADAPAQELVQANAHFFLPRRLRDPFGHDSLVDYDVHDLLIARAEDSLKSATLAENNYRVLQPWRITDPNGNRTSIAFDTLGLVVATAMLGKNGEGDLLEGLQTDLTPAELDAFMAAPRPANRALVGKAAMRIVYDVEAYSRNSQPTFAAALTREVHSSEPNGATSPIQVNFSYSDGFGREIQKKAQAEAGAIVDGGPVVSSRWVGNGWTLFNNKGKPVRQYEPFFTATHAFEFNRQIGVSPTLFYDPVERVVATLHPNHTFEKVIFDAWQHTSWDVNDTLLLDPTIDEDVRGFFARLPDADYLPTWRSRMAASTNANERNAAKRTEPHAGTPTLTHMDALGRPILNVADNGAQGKVETRIALDIEGNQRSVTDARGNEVAAYVYDMLSHQIQQASSDAGARWLLANVAGNPIRVWDERGFTQRLTYDALQRPTALFVAESNSERLAEQTLYGEDKPAPTATNHRGKVWQVRDEAGNVTSGAYDFKGNLIQAARALRGDYKTPANWALQPAPALGESFISSTVFDALGRVIETVTPDGSIIRPRYNEANLLEALAVRIRGAVQAASFVRNIDYNARGQRVRIEYNSDGAPFVTEYRYEPDTFRLARMTTTRPTHADASRRTLQDLRYVYDPIANLAHIQDDAQPAVFFDNACIDASSDYAYDALYRLMAANGREHRGQDAQPGWDDATRTGIAIPYNCAELRQYVETYRYDAAGNILQLAHHAGANIDAPGQTIWNRRYQYAASNNRARCTSLPGEPAQPDYSDDPNLQYAQRYNYDAHGNVTAMPHLPAMRWDFKDRLVEADLRGGGTAHYVYDAGGQRVRKVIERNGATVEERIVIGGYEVFRKRLNGALQLERQSLSVMDDRQRIALIETKTVDNQALIANPQPLIRYQLGNHLGSAALEVDDATKVISYEEYHPYGSTAYQATDQTREAPAKRYRYIGKERDEESGFSYHGARYYAPWLGRWISCDPIGIADDLNVFAYARGSPVTWIDVGGHAGAKITIEGEIVILDNAGKVKVATKSRSEGLMDSSGKFKPQKQSTREMNKAERAAAQTRMDALKKEMAEKVEQENLAEQKRLEQEKLKSDKDKPQDKYKLVVAINVSSVDKKENVQVTGGADGNPGHTFVAIKDPSGKIIKILSYGPVKRGGLSSIGCSAPGDAQYHLLAADEYQTYAWDITKEQSDKALKKMGDIDKDPGAYSGTHQCTTAALEVTDAAGLSSIPRGTGKISIPLCDDAVGVSTPYHLNKELKASGATSTVMKGSDFAGRGVPVQ